jgi:hypothetical protein
MTVGVRAPCTCLLGQPPLVLCIVYALPFAQDKLQ